MCTTVPFWTMESADGTNAHEAIRDLTQCQSPYDALVALEEQPSNPTDMAERANVSRTTVHRWFDTLLDQGWIRIRDDRQYELTAGGVIVRREFERCLETIDRETLASLSRSAYADRLLQALDVGPLTPAEMVGDEDLPSRSTITRIRNRFEDRGWVTRAQGRYRLTSAGVRTLDVYRDLIETIELVDENRAFLEAFRADVTVPCEILDTASLIEVDGNRKLKGKPLVEFTDEVTPALDRFRGMVPVVNPAYIREVRPLLGTETQLEVIADRTVLTNARLEYKDVLIESFAAENLDMYLTLEDISIGVAVFDDEKAQIGAYDENYMSRASLKGTTDEFVNWAVELYESHRRDAQLIPDLASLKNVVSKVSETISERTNRGQ